MGGRKKVAIPDDCIPRCEVCEHHHIDVKDGTNICRRYPPEIVVVTDEIIMAVRTVEPSYRCGEFKRRTN